MADEQLWAVYVHGPADIHPADSFDAAEDEVEELNEAWKHRPNPSEHESSWCATTVPWEGTAEEHAVALAEREHTGPRPMADTEMQGGAQDLVAWLRGTTGLLTAALTHRPEGMSAEATANYVVAALEVAAGAFPAADVRPPAEERQDGIQRDERGHFLGHHPRDCGEHRTVGTHRAWCYDCSEWCYPHDGCARCKVAAMRAAVRIAAPLATHYPGDGQAAEVRTEWGVDYGISGQPALKPSQEEAVRVLALYRALNQSRHVETGEPLRTGRLLRRTVTVGPWVPADASTPEEHDRTEAGR